jgi:hypothetical protein
VGFTQFSPETTASPKAFGVVVAQGAVRKYPRPLGLDVMAAAQATEDPCSVVKQCPDALP